jgi:hypothetical protein
MNGERRRSESRRGWLCVALRAICSQLWWSRRYEGNEKPAITLEALWLVRNVGVESLRCWE